MRCIFTILAMSFCLCFMTGCLPPELQAMLNQSTTDMAGLTTKYKTLYDKAESGEITLNEVKAASKEIRADFETAKKSIIAIKEENVPWWQILIGIAMGIATRGRFSKGLFAGVPGIGTRAPPPT